MPEAASLPTNNQKIRKEAPVPGLHTLESPGHGIRLLLKDWVTAHLL